MLRFVAKLHLMKKNILLFIISLIIISCNNQDDSNNVNQTPYQVNPIEGYLQINMNSLTMHIGDTKTVTANLYNSAGVLQPSSSLVWTSGNPEVATVSNGTIVAVSEGFCEIGVAGPDGLADMLPVNVVANNIVIDASASQVSFQNDFVIMGTNTTTAIPGLTIYNDMGNVVNTDVTFLPPQNSGLTFSGNTISSSSVTGNFDVLILAGNDTLSNSLLVNVVTEGVVNRSLRVVPNSVPEAFYDNNISSTRPILVKVSEILYENGIITQNIFVTSPDVIELNDDSVVLNSQGYLTSVHKSKNNYTFITGSGAHIFAGCVATLRYGDSYVKTGMYVYTNISDTWGVTMSNGDQYNYCMHQGGEMVKYLVTDGYYFNPNPYLHPISGTYYIVKNGEQFFYGSSNLFSGTYQAWGGLFPGQNSVHIWHDGQPISSSITLSLMNDGNTLIQYSTEMQLERGAGNCAPASTNPDPNPGNPTLQQVLAGHTWVLNSCLTQNEGMVSSFTFNINGTWSAPALFYSSETWQTGEHPVSWGIDGDMIVLNSYVLSNPDNASEGYTNWQDVLYVSDYTATTITFGEGDWESDCLHQMTRQD